MQKSAGRTDELGHGSRGIDDETVTLAYNAADEMPKMPSSSAVCGTVLQTPTVPTPSMASPFAYDGGHLVVGPMSAHSEVVPLSCKEIVDKSPNSVQFCSD